MTTRTVKQVWGNNSKIVYGVTYDSVEDKIYWSTSDDIHKGNRNGTQVEMVLSHAELKLCGTPFGLDFDWITGNLYVSISNFNNSCIFVCKARTESAPRCARIASGLPEVHAIAVNPAEGIMFWTTSALNGTLNRAGMDGSNPVQLAAGLAGLRYSEGITIDFHNSRLLWTFVGDDDGIFLSKVETSNMDGTDAKMVLEIPKPEGSDSPWPWGITLFQDTIFWTNSVTKVLNSATQECQTITRLHTAGKKLHGLVVVPHPNTPTNRLTGRMTAPESK